MAGANTGGAATAGAGTSGGTSASGGGGAGSISPASLVPTLNGTLWVGDCGSGTASGLDCPIFNDSGTCVTNGADFHATGAFKVRTHTVAGTPGTQYLLNLELRGVIEGKNYAGGARRSTETAPSQTSNDGWYVGGLPTNTKWSTFEIHVSPPVPGQPVNTQALTCPSCPTLGSSGDNVYYVNALAGADGTHETFPINFTASLPVLGGGKITLIIHDSNCLTDQNCGPGTDPTRPCDSPRSIDLTGMAQKPPNTFMQPLSSPNTPSPWYPQWLFVDVKSVTQP